MKWKISHLKQCLVVTVVLTLTLQLFLLSRNHSTQKTSKTPISNALINNVSVKRNPEFKGEYDGSNNSRLNQRHNILEEININDIQYVAEHHQYEKYVPINASNIKSLPSFSFDESEYIFGSIIERESNSHNLYITTFLLCHHQISDTSVPKKIHTFTRKRWNRAVNFFKNTKYIVL